jgi:hypothetical protein
MKPHPQVHVLGLPGNLTTPVHKAETPRKWHALGLEAHNTGFVRGQVNLHVKQLAKHIQHVQQLLSLLGVRAEQRHIVSIQDVRDAEPAENGARTRKLQLDEVMQQLNKEPKQEWAKLAALLGA